MRCPLTRISCVCEKPISKPSVKSLCTKCNLSQDFTDLPIRKILAALTSRSSPYTDAAENPIPSKVVE